MGRRGRPPDVGAVVVRCCPVCWRMVPMRRVVGRHLDTADGACPMSGKWTPTRWIDGIRALPRARVVQQRVSMDQLRETA